MKKVVVILILITLFFSCTSRFDGYDELGDGIYMKLLSFEDSKQNIKEVKYVKAEIRLNVGEDMLYHNFSEYILPVNNSFKKLISQLNEGDSAVFIVAKKSFKNEKIKIENKQFDYYNIYIKVYEIYNEEEYQKVKNEQDNELIEQIVLKKYLKQVGITKQDKKNGVYIVHEKEGEGEPIKNGDKVVINYKAYFVNQIEFDNTYKDIAFTFTFGSPDQVIKGLELALKGMKLNEEATIVIPSQLAFGDEGSSTGVVPSYSTVTYKLKIVKIEGN